MTIESAKGVERGLAALEALTHLGAASVAELAEATGFSHQASYRMLEALRGAGFAYRASTREPYRATAKVAALAGTLPQAAVVAAAARAPLAAAAARSGWPVLLAAPEDVELVILETAGSAAKAGLPRLLPGQRTPQFLRASGAVCRAFSTPEQARAVWRRTLALYRDRLFVRDEAQIEAMAALVRKRGFVVYEPLRSSESAVAVPVRFQGGRIYGLELRFIARAVRTRTLETEIVPLLQATADEIVRRAGQVSEQSPKIGF